MFWKDLPPLLQKTCKLPSVWLETLEKHCQKNVLEGFLIYMLELATGIGSMEKLEENTVNSGIFNGWGDKGIGSVVEHDVFDRFYGDKSVKYRALKETIAKTSKHIQRTRDLGDYPGVVV